MKIITDQLKHLNVIPFDFIMKIDWEKIEFNKAEGEKIKLNCFRNGKDEAIGIDIIENELKIFIITLLF